MNRTWSFNFSHHGKEIFNIKGISDGQLGKVLKVADMMWEDIVHRNGPEFNMLINLKEHIEY